MRLKPQEVTSIIAGIEAFEPGPGAKLYLYGSRVHDDLKGGDIDLLLLVDDPKKAQELSSEKYAILNELKKRIGDRRIDLTIASARNANSDPFLKQILAEGAVALREWVLVP